MNSEHLPSSRFQALCERARAHRTPPGLWPAIAARARSRSRRRPWLALASLAAGAVVYLSAVRHVQPPAESEAALAPILSAAVLDAGRFGAEPLAGHGALLRHLSATPTRRSR